MRGFSERNEARRGQDFGGLLLYLDIMPLGEEGWWIFLEPGWEESSETDG